MILVYARHFLLHLFLHRLPELLRSLWDLFLWADPPPSPSVQEFPPVLLHSQTFFHILFPPLCFRFHQAEHLIVSSDSPHLFVLASVLWLILIWISGYHQKILSVLLMQYLQSEWERVIHVWILHCTLTCFSLNVRWSHLLFQIHCSSLFLVLQMRKANLCI